MFFKKLHFFLFILLFGSCFSGAVQAFDMPDEKKAIFNHTGYPLPRFVSVDKSKANVRTGPGKKYPIKWTIMQENLPVEIILEFENWRKIRDFEGQEGWIYHSLLSRRRTALIAAVHAVPAYTKRRDKGVENPSISMLLAPLSLVEIDQCAGGWCRVLAEKLSGWIEIKSLWGVYEHENID